MDSSINMTCDMKKNIAVLMTVHNRKEKTLACVKNILQQEGLQNITLQVYLTDDGCTDGTIEAVKEYFPDLIIIKGNGSLFWNRGMNYAWREAAKSEHDFYLWLNDDTMLKKEAINILIKCAEQTNSQSIIVGSTYASESIPLLTYGGRKRNRKHTLIPPHENHLIECDTFNGNIVLIPRNVFQKVGYNDEYFHHSFGDIEYGLRASKLGLKNYIAPGILGYCKRNNPIPIFRRKNISLFKRYKLLYSPLGYNPKEDYHLNKKFYPLILCILWFIKLHINVLFTKDHTLYN